MQEANKFKLGLFVLISIILFIIAVTFMGFFDDFQPKAYLTTHITESVQGLSNGSLVKYKGVPIGNVEEILIIAESLEIQINMKIDLTKIHKRTDIEQAEAISEKQFYAYLNKEVRNGLACRLEMDGITGNKYIELDFFDKGKGVRTLPNELYKNGVFYIPSMPSMMSNLKKSVIEILADIAAIDFKGISKQLNTLLTTANKTIQDAQLDKLVKQANNVVSRLAVTVDNMNNSLTQKKLEKTIQEIDTAFISIRTLSDQLNKIAARSSIPETTTAIRELSQSLNESSDALQASLQKANEAMDSMTDLIQYLNANPSSVIRGRSKEKNNRNFVK